MYDPIYNMTVDAVYESDLATIDATIAMESLDSETTVVGNYFNQSSKYLLRDYEKALDEGDISAAIKKLGEIEALAKRCKKDLDNVPIESRTKRHLLFLAKVTAYVIGTVMLLNIGDIAGKTATILKNSFSQVPDAALKAQLEKQVAKGAVDRMVASSITQTGMRLKTKGGIRISDIFRILVNPITTETKEKYADDPRAVSKTYLRLQQTLDRSLFQMQEAKALLRAELSKPEN